MRRLFTGPGNLLLLLAVACGGAGAEALTIERMFAAPALSGPSLRSPRISPDGRLVTYLLGKADAPTQFDLWAYEIASGRRRLLVDSALLAPAQQALSAEEAQRRERQRTAQFSGIVEYAFAADSRHLLVPLGGDLYVCDLRAPAAHAIRRITETSSYETDARFSPKGRYVSFVRDQNLVIFDLKTGTETAVTRDGAGAVSFATAEFVAQEEMGRNTGYWWSPDERYIAFTRVDETPVTEVQRFEILADDVRVVKQRYPVAGTANARVELFVARLGDGGATTPTAAVRIDLGSDPDFYLARVTWFPDSATLAVQKESRDQKTLVLLAASPVNGATRELLQEHGQAWVELGDEFVFLKKSSRFVWASNRTGFRHLYLYRNDGSLLRALTSGDWSVIGDGSGSALAGVDEARDTVYFMATAETPLERQLYAVALDQPGATPRRITAPGGWHSVIMSEDARVLLDTYSTPDRPPSVTVRKASGTSVGVLLGNALTGDHPYAPYLADHVPTEFGTLRARDGQTLYYQLNRPRDLVQGRRYPVIVDVYGGPGGQKVRRAWGSSARNNDGFFHQYLAQHGYVVFSLDNRGTGSRGVAFDTAIYGQLGSVEVEDQVTGVEFLKTLAFVDPKRIGVFGWSYGGYLALMCIMQAPESFAAAVAGAPVTDWRHYDTHYTERYLGTPRDNPQGYAASTVMSHAAGLRGELLIMHGMADDNVLFSNSTALFKRLQDLGKPFHVMVYPGSKHGLLRFPVTGPHGYHAITRFFDETLLPDHSPAS